MATFLIFGGYILSSQTAKPAEQSQLTEKKLAEFLLKNQANSDIAEAYRFALENPQNVLSEVKCYCGCLIQGHSSNRDCFINSDGSFDLMGLNCGLCIKTALTAKQMLTDGKTVQEISDYVDTRWGKN